MQSFQNNVLYLSVFLSLCVLRIGIIIIIIIVPTKHMKGAEYSHYSGTGLAARSMLAVLQHRLPVVWVYIMLA